MATPVTPVRLRPGRWRFELRVENQVPPHVALKPPSGQVRVRAAGGLALRARPTGGTFAGPWS